MFGLFQAIYMANAGGAWDNAKKLVEVDLKEKGTPLHAATVVGDTVGDPFKDTTSVALNPIIKFSTLFGLLAVEIAVANPGDHALRRRRAVRWSRCSSSTARSTACASARTPPGPRSSAPHATHRAPAGPTGPAGATASAARAPRAPRRFLPPRRRLWYSLRGLMALRCGPPRPLLVDQGERPMLAPPLRHAGLMAACGLALLLAAVPAPAASVRRATPPVAPGLPVEEHVLSNGMKRVLVPRHLAPTVSGGWVAARRLCQ